MTTLKVVVLGDSTVGKSSLVQRYIYDTTDANQMPTIGAAMLPKRIQTANFQGTLTIWDTAGQERYRSLAPLYYRNADIGLVVYDITNRRSYDNARTLLTQFRSAEPDAVVGFIGNKLDLADTIRAINSDEAEQFAHEHKAYHFEVSSLSDNAPITAMMEQLVGKCRIPNRVIDTICLDELIDDKRHDKPRSCC